MEAAVNIHSAGRLRITSRSPDEIKEYGIALHLAGAEQQLAAAGYGSSAGSNGLGPAFAAVGVLGSFGRSTSGGGGGGAVNRPDNQDRTSTLKVGPFAGKSIPARGPGRDFTRDERRQIDEIGYDTGCHTCGTKNPGTKSGHFILDHQPSSALNVNNKPQNLYPHCLNCSLRQGGEVRQARQK
jgi:hypothetical protein